MDKDEYDSRYTRIALARRHDLSIEEAERLFLDADREVQKALVSNPVIGPQFHRRVVEEQGVDLALAVVPFLNETELLTKVMQRSDVSPSLALLHRGVDVPEEVLALAVEHPVWVVRATYARSHFVRETHAERLAADRDLDVVKALAGNPSVPERIRVVARMRAEAGRRSEWAVGSREIGDMDAEKMAAERFKALESEGKVRVLSDGSCPVDVVRAGAQDEDPHVREVAVGHPNAPVDVIRAGVEDEDEGVRRAAVGNPGAPEDVIRAGAVDENAMVREAAVGNPNAPEDVIRAGIEDKDWQMRRAAVGNLHAPEDVIRAGMGDKSGRVRMEAVGNPSASEDVIRAGAADKDWWVRKAAMENPSAPVDMIRAWFEDKDPAVRMVAVRNPSAPEDVIMAGVGDRHSWVRWEALSNLSAPVDALVAAMRYRGSKTRQLIASHPHLPEDLAVKLSMSKMKEVQEALAGNPVVSERIRVVARLKAEAGRM